MTWDWALDGWIILAGVLSATSCALLGNYLVLRKMSLMGDAISHAVLPGLAIAFILSNSRSAWPMFMGAVIVGVFTALMIEAINRYGKVETGAAMGVVFSTLFAIGLVLIRQVADHVDLDPGCVLYGNIVQIPLDAFGGGIPPAITNLAVVLALNAAFVALLYKELKISSFDPELATTQGINASWMHYALMIMTAVTTVANFEVVGSILVIAMLIVPPVVAHLLTDRLGAMIALSLVVAISAAMGGHVLALFGPGWIGLDATANTSAMMAVVAGMLLALALLFSPHHGLIGRAYHRWALAQRIVQQDILGLLYRWHEMRPGENQPLPREHVLEAVGDGALARWAIRSLLRRCHVESRIVGGCERGLELSKEGRAAATQLIRSHRLWEVYLAKHFNLPPDHLHEPAERMEHFITDELHEQLAHDLTMPSHDPHGRSIPEPDNP